MFEKLVPVNKSRHADKKIKQVPGFGFAAGFHIASLLMHEFAHAASTYPIVFIEDKDRDSFISVALLGLEAGENLFVDAEDKWQAPYVPAIIRRYPFALAETDQEGQYSVCVDEASPLLSQDEGKALFTDEGEPSELLENVKRYLSELRGMDELTQEFCGFLAEQNMLTPLNLQVRQGDHTQSITGCYVINEERLNNLSDERFLEFRRKRYLPAVYGHLVSLAQIERLVTLKDARLALAKAS